mmetsp:Transcript_55037/g.175048  ORF Transcript_55037/g.175048 Transcript_55037/m.175048 type:complete len:244 (-) Transcript_55037:677-1408(-)
MLLESELGQRGLPLLPPARVQEPVPLEARMHARVVVAHPRARLFHRAVPESRHLRGGLRGAARPAGACGGVPAEDVAEAQHLRAGEGGLLAHEVHQEAAHDAHNSPLRAHPHLVAAPGLADVAAHGVHKLREVGALEPGGGIGPEVPLWAAGRRPAHPRLPGVHVQPRPRLLRARREPGGQRLHHTDPPGRGVLPQRCYVEESRGGGLVAAVGVAGVLLLDGPQPPRDRGPLPRPGARPEAAA